MEQIIKERLIGAIVVTLLAVIFVPWVLDGQTDDLVKEQALALPAQAVAQRFYLQDEEPIQLVEVPSSVKSTTIVKKPMPSQVKAIPVVVPEERSEPANQVVASNPKPVVVNKPASNEIKPTAVEQSVVAKSGQEDYWAAQVGSFGQQSNAQRLVDRLAKKGFMAFVSRHTNARQEVLYRVRVGPYDFKQQAEHAAQRLRQEVDTAAVVAHP